MSITREQAIEILRRVRVHDFDLQGFVEFLDSLVAEPVMSRCSDELREQGKAYPRTCAECGLGPCKRPHTPDAEPEPAEQPYGPLSSVAEVQAEEEARLHADDARAAMAAYISGHTAHYGHENHWPIAAIAIVANEAADEMAAERKRRMT